MHIALGNRHLAFEFSAKKFHEVTLQKIPQIVYVLQQLWETGRIPIVESIYMLRNSDFCIYFFSCFPPEQRSGI